MPMSAKQCSPRWLNSMNSIIYFLVLKDENIIDGLYERVYSEEHNDKKTCIYNNNVVPVNFGLSL